MKKIFSILFIAITSHSYSQNVLEDKLFTQTDLLQDLDFLFNKLNEIHPNVYAYTSKEDIEKSIQHVREELNRPMTRMEFALKVIPLVTSLKDAHTSLTLPQEERTKFLNNGGLVFPFDIRISDSRIFVRRNYSSDSTIKVNSEILMINGLSGARILSELRKYVSAELDSYRDIRVERDFRRLLWYIFQLEDNFILTVSRNESVEEKTVRGLNQKDFESKLSSSGSSSSKPFSFYQVEGNTGVIDFRQMIQEKEFHNFLDSVFTVIKNNNIENLVIDIRRNGGGNSQLADMLFNYISVNPYKMVEQTDIKVSKEARIAFRKNHLKWYLYPLYPIALFHPQARLYLFGKSGKMKTFTENKPQTPRRNEKLKFTGRTFLLTSNYTISSANMLAAAYKCYNMGTIVGEETGGVLTAYGDLIRFQLPNTQLNAFCSHKRFIHPCNDGTIHGVKPDIEIKPTANDIKNERDVVIEYIKSVIKKSM